MDDVTSPFGAGARKLISLPTARVVEMYRQRCAVDVSAHFHGLDSIDLYECERTGYQFWRPETLAGDEAFYQQLSSATPDYYRTTRWEYAPALELCRRGQKLLEIGCGAGHFLRQAEAIVAEVQGLELNREAIAQSVPGRVLPQTIEAFAPSAEAAFDVVCSFHVLEHVVHPDSFLRSALSCVRPGGLLILSTPNSRHVTFELRRDPFDLPPHHMGHFSRDAYGRVAEVLGAELVQVIEEPRRASLEEVSERTRQRASYRLVRSFTRFLLDFSYRMSGEPGPGILVVFRRPLRA
jgi:2-polyprenyl-3-methyl-5-hydroxy-6-metoxy-1,4-benzoquinol methylase